MRIIFDTKGFTEEEVKFSHSALSAILHERGIVHGGINPLAPGEFDIATDDAVEITAEDILAKVSEQANERDAATRQEVSALDVFKARIATASSFEEVKTIINELWPAS